MKEVIQSEAVRKSGTLQWIDAAARSVTQLGLDDMTCQNYHCAQLIWSDNYIVTNSKLKKNKQKTPLLEKSRDENNMNII